MCSSLYCRSSMSINQRSSVRIISGSKRGSKVQFLAAPGLRPSGDRIRETLFAWVQTSISGSRCLDMFAGSGALGFEAASRGAERVVMLEKNSVAAASLQENADRLQFDNVDIYAADALTADTYQLKLPGHQFDLLFIDPPFAENLHQTAIDLVQQQQLLKPDALIYLETGKRDNLLQVPIHWQLFREKVAGEVRIQLYRTIAAE